MIAIYEAPPPDEPGITVVDIEWANVPKPPEPGVHDAGIINLIPMREVRLRIVDDSHTVFTGASVCIWNGPTCWFPVSFSGLPYSTLLVDADKTNAELRESLRVWVPSLSATSWLPVDGQRIVMTESGNDEITVTVRDSSPLVPDTSPVGSPVTLDVTSDQ
jgi:hypothetical protein